MHCEQLKSPIILIWELRWRCEKNSQDCGKCILKNLLKILKCHIRQCVSYIFWWKCILVVFDNHKENPRHLHLRRDLQVKNIGMILPSWQCGSVEKLTVSSIPKSVVADTFQTAHVRPLDFSCSWCQYSFTTCANRINSFPGEEVSNS